VKRGQAIRDGLCGGGDRDGERGGHRDGLAYDSCTPPPPPAKVRKVFEVDTLRLYSRYELRRLGESVSFDSVFGGIFGRWFCQVR
jgi:hypothetical protein